MAVRQIVGMDFLINASSNAGFSFLGTFGPYWNTTSLRGGYSRRVLNIAGSGSNYIIWIWPKPPSSSATSGFVGFAATANPTATLAKFFSLNSLNGVGGYDSSTYMVRLASVGTALHIYNAAGDTSIANATGVFTKPGDTAPFYFIEVGWTISGSSSTSVTVRVDGVTVLSGVTVALPRAANLIKAGVFMQEGYPYNLMDIYLSDNTGTANLGFLGDCRVEYLTPVAEGANTAWTNVSGANKTSSVSTADATATYIRSTAVGQRETFTLTDLQNTAGTIVAVEAEIIATQGSTAPQVLGATARVGSTNYDSASGSAVPQSGFGLVPVTFDRSPASGTFWTASEVNGMEVGPVILS